jgi:hypothetical protein
MRHIQLDWTHKTGWVAEVQPHILDAPIGFGRTSAQAVADLHRQDPEARKLPVVMAAKGERTPCLQLAPHYGRR